MTTKLAPTIGRHDHPPQPLGSPAPHPVRRVGPVDRAAMHLGLALIRWGRRPATARRRERAVLAPESVDARRDLDRARDEQLALMLIRLR
ncbi:hypothetical protein K2F54_09995 [Cryobacterium sp. 1639]|uniref:hypothetical protein n=1 Tax=Cryobacterium inferilacus TaxID=2866629 RepID=UPI001C72A4D2|nr:hypothetical protein [Cryobacterium sp. 1639]MBX0300305.1 hypothetical protein [Cryobacterium sp. 1639]